MFGEMVGIWLLTSFRNYDSAHKEDAGSPVPEALQSINLVEIGPGTGIMMSDMLRVSTSTTTIELIDEANYLILL